MEKEIRVKLIRAPWFARKYSGKEGILKIIDEPHNITFQPSSYSNKKNSIDYVSSPLVITNYDWEDEDDTTLIVCDKHKLFTGNIFTNEDFVEDKRYFFIFEILSQKQKYDIHIESVEDKCYPYPSTISDEVDYIKECANNIEYGNIVQEITDIFSALGDIMRISKISAKEINEKLKEKNNEK